MNGYCVAAIGEIRSLTFDHDHGARTEVERERCWKNLSASLSNFAEIAEDQSPSAAVNGSMNSEIGSLFPAEGGSGAQAEGNKTVA